MTRWSATWRGRRTGPKALYRGRGIACPGRAVYQPGQREAWLSQLPGGGAQSRAGVLYRQIDQLRALHREAKRALLAESRKHGASEILRRVPGLASGAGGAGARGGRDAAPVPDQAAVVALLRAGGGDALERGL